MAADRDPSPSGEGSAHVRYADGLRRAFRLLNRRFMVPMWRLGLGGMLNSWPTVGGRLMVLVHRGRRSGREYRTPLNYAIVDGQVYCLAGFGGGSDWEKILDGGTYTILSGPDRWKTGRTKEIGGAYCGRRRQPPFDDLRHPGLRAIGTQDQHPAPKHGRLSPWPVSPLGGCYGAKFVFQSKAQETASVG